MTDKIKNIFSIRNIIISICVLILLLLSMHYFNIYYLIRGFVYVLIPFIKDVILIILGIQLIRLIDAYIKKIKS